MPKPSQILNIILVNQIISISIYESINTSVAQDKGHVLLVFGKWLSSSQLSSYWHLPVFTPVLRCLALSRMYQSLCAANWGLVAYTGAQPDGAKDQNIELKAAQSCGLKCADSGWNPQEYKGFIWQYRNTASCRWLYCMQKASHILLWKNRYSANCFDMLSKKAAHAENTAYLPNNSKMIKCRHPTCNILCTMCANRNLFSLSHPNSSQYLGSKY